MPGLTMSTRDPDEAAAAGGDVYFPHSLDVRHTRPRFRMSLSAVFFPPPASPVPTAGSSPPPASPVPTAVSSPPPASPVPTPGTLGPVSAGVLGYSGEVVLQTAELETGYEVNVPLTGHLRTWIGHTEVCATPDRAAVYPPDRPARLHGWSDGGGVFGVKIERYALERRLAELTDGRASGPVRFGETLDLATGGGRQWWSLAGSLLALTAEPDGPLSRPMVARPLADMLITTLLYVADHPYRGLVDAPVAVPRPSTIQRAVELMHAEPGTPWTVPEIAARVGLSVRGLQDGFARHVGRPPTAELRRIRLDRAHDELCAADPARTSVADVAARWGFVHLGRFAAEYRRRHGRAPSEHLRAP